MDEITEELARALAAPGVARFAESRETQAALDAAGVCFAELAGGANTQLERAQRIVAMWAERLDDLREGTAYPGTRACRDLAGAAIALSVVARADVELMSAEDAERVAGAVLSHALGVLRRERDGEGLFDDPQGALRAEWASAAALVEAIPGAPEGEGPPSSAGRDWLWLELEEAAARAAATAAVFALELD